MSNETSTFTAVRACCIVLLAGAVLQAELPEGAVTAGKGKVIDWRTVRCGETLQEGADAFDTAQLFVALVGPEVATAAAVRDEDIEDAPPNPVLPPEVHAFMANEHGCRVRQFTVGAVRVRVEALDWLGGEDADGAKMAEDLAYLAAGLVS
jgi:hypothetical protein